MDIEATARELAALRAKGEVGSVGLNRLTSLREAYAVQEAAIAALEGNIIGYSMTGTSDHDRRRFGLEYPVWGELLDTEEFDDLKMPRGIIGMAPALCFVFGSNYPRDGERIGASSLLSSVACMCGVVRLFGRRVHSSIPLTSVTAAADFGLNAGFSRGPRLPLLESGDTRPVPLSIQMDDEMLCREPLRILDGGVRSALWLASELSDRGRCIEAGMKVIAEACTPIYQVTAGRMATVVFGDAEPMVVRYR